MLEAGWSNAYVGLPWLDGGRDSAGLDCWGLVRLVYEDRFGVELPSLSDGYRDTRDFDAIANLYEVERCDWIERPGPAPGDVVAFRIIGIPLHVGVIVDARSFLHAWVERGTCLDRLTSPAWRPRILGFYRHRLRS